MPHVRPVLVLVALALLATSLAPAGEGPDWWPRFRGPDALGIADGTPLPRTWNGESGDGIAWKTAIPGLGHSSPAIWGDRLFVTTAVSASGDAGLRTGLYGDIKPVDDDAVHRFQVWCLDRRTGEVLWVRTAHESAPAVKRHTKSTHANPTPAVDGERVVVSFGSEGLHAYALDGEHLWSRDLGVLDAGYFVVPAAQWGYASSPVLHDGRVIVQADIQKGSFLAAFDASTGEEVWRTARNDVPTWSTPTVHVEGDRAQVVVNGYRHIGGYDLATGEELWRMAGTGDIPVPTPYVVDGRIHLTSAHGPGSPIYAIRTTASGTIEPDESGHHEHLAWSHPRGGSYLPTTVVYDGLMYVNRDNGSLGVYDAATGERLYQERLGSGSTGFTASTVAGDGKVYFTDEDGVTRVLAAGRTYHLLAENELGEVVLASPAIADGTLYFRTRDHVVAVRGATETGGDEAVPPVPGDLRRTDPE